MDVKKEMDMTHGALLGKILLFALPLIASNVLQLLFNAADVIVIGRFSGQTSLAAVGSTTSIINLLVNLLIGLSVGINVIAAYCYGMTSQQERLKQTMHTSVLVAIIGGVIFGAIGVLGAPLMLRLTAVPSDIFPLAVTYLRIYFIGMPFSMIYNYGAALLRARGDTRRPLLYLSISGIVNVGLNLVFVIALKMDVAGVALATILSQLLSAVLILRFFRVSQDELHLEWREMRIDTALLRSIAKIGVPAGIQSALFNISNVVMQGSINVYGGVIIAGSSASSSIEGFVYAAMNSFHHTAQTFVGQNVAVQKPERVRRVVQLCLICVAVLGVSASALAVIFARPLVSLYNTDPAVVAAAVQRLRFIVAPYAVFGLTDVLMGSIRGHGISLPPVIINLICTCVFRILWLTLLPVPGISVRYVYATWPLSWALLLLVLIVYWLYLRRKGRIGVANM